ncbi:hypothetical protein [Poseidonibacter ostreae]|jgi:hypothetical protein|uniref:Helix-turn-helix domain-containing protein n=1 Tax=Poseidonibacter ostreae TaxID=2654171 RepID=A0A6L4WSF3_9BACT|nr:hypothetical protein [Poseidonibacter ostreae]KAB7887135.1 hypothetical protein GA417_03665 [Poseidonibacter ostreae]KAB7888641.1 hypothetical protein GBG19_08505 [Poseidonibacter ostreae]KAB7892312.1 hypothetical protein GBG18_03415 [Poseidonibacter ostreae]
MENKIRPIKEQSERKGISVPMIKKLIFNKKLEYVKVGAKVFISDAVIEDYIQSNTVKVEEV